VVGEVEKGECWRGGVRAKGSVEGSTSFAILEEGGTPKGRPEGMVDDNRSIYGQCLCVYVYMRICICVYVYVYVYVYGICVYVYTCV